MIEQTRYTNIEFGALDSLESSDACDLRLWMYVNEDEE